MRAFVTSRPALAALALSFVVAACDTDGDYYEESRGEVRVVDFRLDALDYDVSADNLTASFESDDVDSGETRDQIERSLADASTAGALVMLYIDSELVNIQPGAEFGTWAALPLSRSFEGFVSGEGDVAVVYTASYEFSFDNDDLYFDVVSSAPFDAFDESPDDFIARILPQRIEDGPDQLLLRLVTIPADRYYNQAGLRVDLRDYEAVKRAYNLPD